MGLALLPRTRLLLEMTAAPVLSWGCFTQDDPEIGSAWLSSAVPPVPVNGSLTKVATLYYFLFWVRPGSVSFTERASRSIEARRAHLGAATGPDLR